MDRNDRRHLPDFHQLVARGLRHSLYGGPDHVDGVESQWPCLAAVGGKSECEEEDQDMEEEQADKPIETNGQTCKCDKQVIDGVAGVRFCQDTHRSQMRKQTEDRLVERLSVLGVNALACYLENEKPTEDRLDEPVGWLSVGETVHKGCPLGRGPFCFLLRLATINNLPGAIRAILGYGHQKSAHICTCRDANGDTTIHLACREGHRYCMEALAWPAKLSSERAETGDLTGEKHIALTLAKECSELRNYEGLSCLHLAALNNHFDIVYDLVNWLGVDVNLPEGKRGMTALVCCVERRKVQMVMYLVQQCHASIHTRTYDRKNAYELAQGRGYREIANLLKSLDPLLAEPE